MQPTKKRPHPDSVFAVSPDLFSQSERPDLQVQSSGLSQIRHPETRARPSAHAPNAVVAQLSHCNNLASHQRLHFAVHIPEMRHGASLLAHLLLNLSSSSFNRQCVGIKHSQRALFSTPRDVRSGNKNAVSNRYSLRLPSSYPLSRRHTNGPGQGNCSRRR